MLSKFFDEMRLLRSLRPPRSLRLLRPLRPLRLLMPGKSLNMPSASFHSQKKGINKPKTLEKKLKVSLHYVHSNSLLHIFFCTHSELRLCTEVINGWSRSCKTDAKEITQYAKCKHSLSEKRHKLAKNIGKSFWKYLYIMYIQTPFCISFLHPFRTEAVEDRDVISNQIQVS